MDKNATIAGMRKKTFKDSKAGHFTPKKIFKVCVKLVNNSSSLKYIILKFIERLSFAFAKCILE